MEARGNDGRGAWTPCGSLGVKGQGWDWRGPPNPTSPALAPVGPVVQKGCAPTGAGRRGVPAGHKHDPGQTLRALPHVSASLGTHQPGSKWQSKGQTEQNRFLHLQHGQGLLKNLWFVNIISFNRKWGSSSRRTRKP